MSAIQTSPVTARAVLICSVCSTRWQSVIYTVEGRKLLSEIECAPAWRDGWRVYVSIRGHVGQRTYCPDHSPTVTLRQVYP